MVALLALATVAAACGGTSGQAGKVTYVAAGQIPIPDRPQLHGHGKEVVSTANTIPIAKQNPVSGLFTAMGQFSSCLSGKGMTFIGIPSKSNPGAATNSPAYITALKTCAANSNILQALKNAQSSQDNLTPAQVKTENKDYLVWRKCMIARGWGIPVPKPNAKGLLFSFGGSGGGTATSSSGPSGFKPPPGQSLLNSPDMAACAAKASPTA